MSDDLKVKVLYVSAELFPLLKTGGLADVSAALPPALAAQGADVRLLLPAFPSVQAGVTPSGPALPLPAGRDAHHHHHPAHHPAWPAWVHSLPAGLGPLAHTADGSPPWLQAGHITASGQPVWLLHAPGLYEQGQHPYHDDNGHAWANSAARFAWLGWAAALLGLGLDSAWTPDVVHGHDWHTGLGLAYLHHLGAHAHLPRPATVFTIHNLAYQGVFGPEVRTPLGLPATLFHMHGLEYHGNVSFMKAGLVFSDAITTVSPTYAREITRPEQGCGLDGVLRHRQSVLHGILNGVDDTVWNPATDPLVQPGYSADDLGGKAQAKARLQQRMGLQASPGALLCCVVSRLTSQKGLHLLPEVVDDLVASGGQLAVLGTGDQAIVQALQEAQRRHPDSVALHVGYDEALAHQLIGGSDMILVPSQFEPCGLTQLYGLRYGTLPLVRAVGGLADTVTDCTLENIDDGSATGVVFGELSAWGLRTALRRALALYRRPADWQTVQRNAMRQHFDWASAARAYLGIYRNLLARPLHTRPGSLSN